MKRVILLRFPAVQIWILLDNGTRVGPQRLIITLPLSPHTWTVIEGTDCFWKLKLMKGVLENSWFIPCTQSLPRKTLEIHKHPWAESKGMKPSLKCINISWTIVQTRKTIGATSHLVIAIHVLVHLPKQKAVVSRKMGSNTERSSGAGVFVPRGGVQDWRWWRKKEDREDSPEPKPILE